MRREMCTFGVQLEVLGASAGRRLTKTRVPQPARPARSRHCDPDHRPLPLGCATVVTASGRWTPRDERSKRAGQARIAGRGEFPRPFFIGWKDLTRSLPRAPLAWGLVGKLELAGLDVPRLPRHVEPQVPRQRRHAFLVPPRARAPPQWATPAASTRALAVRGPTVDGRLIPCL